CAQYGPASLTRCPSDLGPILDALVASSAGRLKNELKKKLGELEPELKVATEKVVEKLAASNLERTAQAADEKVDAALASLDHTLDRKRTRLHSSHGSNS